MVRRCSGQGLRVLLAALMVVALGGVVFGEDCSPPDPPLPECAGEDPPLLQFYWQDCFNCPLFCSWGNDDWRGWMNQWYWDWGLQCTWCSSVEKNEPEECCEQTLPPDC